jgi:hypothetical protein
MTGRNRFVYLANFLLAVLEESREVIQNVAVQHGLGLLVRAGDDVADGAQGRRLDLDLLVGEQRDEGGDDVSLDDHLDLVVAAVEQVAQGPDRVDEYVGVAMVDQDAERGEDLTDRLRRWWRLLGSLIGDININMT